MENSLLLKKESLTRILRFTKQKLEVDADTSGDLADKLKLALQHFKNLGIKGVVQGDLLFTKADLKNVTYQGERYITFHPNTIVYAVPINSALGKQIAKSKIGVVWHTSYSGDTFETMRASFAKPIASELRTSRNVFSTDAFVSRYFR